MDTMKTTNTPPETSLREKYFNKEIFNVGDLVESNNVEFKIISRGTNYLFLEDIYGNKTKKWIQDVTPMIQEQYTLEDQLRISVIISEALGSPQTTKSPTENINAALTASKAKYGQSDYADAVRNMLKTVSSVGINYDKKLAPKDKAVYTMLPLGKSDNDADDKAGGISDNDSDDIQSTESDFDTTKHDVNGAHTRIGNGIEGSPNKDHLRRMKIKYAMHEGAEHSDSCACCKSKECGCCDSLSDKEIDDIVKPVDTLEDIIDAYDDDEIHMVDEEGKHVKPIAEDVEGINEVLGRLARIKAGIRFAQTSSKRERRIKIVLHTRSTPSRINHRARVMAIKLFKARIMKKPLANLSIPEKERLEQILARPAVVRNLSRIALKLAPKIRAIENNRLHPNTQ
jgi:hypothetical protein